VFRGRSMRPLNGCSARMFWQQIVTSRWFLGLRQPIASLAVQGQAGFISLIITTAAFSSYFPILIMNPKKQRRNRKQSNRNRQSSAQSQSLVPAGPARTIPSMRTRVERITARYSGSSMTLATTAGYSYFTISSARFSEASPWTQLSALYMFIRPLYARVTITSCRATGTADNPIVCFAPTPDGQAIASASMNLNTFETPVGRTVTLPPGRPVSYAYKPYIAVAAYNTPINGYIPMIAPRCSKDSLPLVYFGDLLLSTPGVTITTTANYIQLKVDFVFAFDTLDSSLTQ